MGLDMYLYVQRWVESNHEKYGEIKDVLGIGADYESNREWQYPVKVEGTVAYWRKSNAIHNWFVENVQNGEDNCGRYSVSDTSLRNLRDTCQRVIANRGNSNPAELETKAGFFYGSTEYGDDYWEDLRITVEKLDKALGVENPLDVEYIYYSSW
jgi:hypothetical protein